MSSPPDARASRGARAAEELKRFAVISAYLFVCFSVILFYEASQSPARQVSWVGLGVALGKALVMGKFILIGEALKAGDRVRAPTLLHRVAWRSLGLLIVLIVLKFLEHLIVGMAHKKSVASILAELGDQSWPMFLAPVMLMLLILIPLVTVTEIDRALGPAGLRGLLLGRKD